MPPVLAVVVAFLVSVSLGFVMHSRWSFRGHGQREDHKLKVKFLAVQSFGFVLNEIFTWVLTGPLVHGPTWWPLSPGDLRHSARHLRAQPAAGFPLMERVVYQQMAELDDRHWWYRARRQVLAALIRREDAAAQAMRRILELGCGTGHNLAMLSGFGHVDGLELDEEARALSEKRLGRKVMSAPLPELAGVPRPRLRPHRRVRRDRAYRRRPRRARVDRRQAQAERQVRDDRARPSMDVVGARRRQPPQAPLLKACAEGADRQHRR